MPFDFVADGVRWLGVAIAGKPFRGTEYNIAYRKEEVFFRNSGFARSLNPTPWRRDDIFVSQVAGHATTLSRGAVAESMVRLRHGNHPAYSLNAPCSGISSPKVLSAVARGFCVSPGRMVAACRHNLWRCGGFIISWLNLQATLVALVIVAVMLTIDIITWRKAQEKHCARAGLLLSIPWLAVLYPVRRMVSHIHSLLGRQKKYTWD